MTAISKDRAAREAARAMERIISTRGARTNISRTLKIAHQSVMAWKVVPVDRVFEVGAILRIAVTELRPDFFMDDPLRQRAVESIMARRKRP